MNSQFHKSQALTHYSLKHSKKRLGRDQNRVLEESFLANPKLKAEFKLELAQRLGVSPKQIAIWYQNRRARHRTETKEHEYNRIQQELRNVLAEKIRLEKEVCSLKYEIKKVQEMLGLASDQPENIPLSGSVSEDDLSYLYSPYEWPNSSEENNACISYPVNMLEEYVSNQSLLTESVNCDQETYNDCKMYIL